MSKFIIACPSCGGYAQASTGFFARRYIHCACGFTIDVKTDRMGSRVCASCGNTVVYDQADGKSAKCPICGQKLLTDAALNNLFHFRCTACGCELQAAKNAERTTCPVCDAEIDIPAEVKKAEVREKGLPVAISYEDGNDTFVYKHPVTDFVTGSRLIVHESQEAIFLRNGEMLDSFGAGAYELETDILPKMRHVLPLPVQGRPFHAEVYFVNLTTQMGIKWGTNSKVGLFDPATGMHVELGASGSFNLRVIDARRLLLRLVGTSGGLTQGELFNENSVTVEGGGVEISVKTAGGYFRTMVMTKVKANLARIIKANRISVLELDEQIERISQALKESINSDLAEYGLEMPEFYVANIMTPEDDPNFRRMKQQYANQYLRVREEEIKKAEAEAAFERRAVEAQTEARMRVIGAQGDADVTRIRAEAEAEAYRMKAEAEAQEMRMKGYTYQQETQREVSIEAMRNGGAGSMAGSVTGMMGGAMQLGLGLSAAGSVIGMAKEAMKPVENVGAGWTCVCGQGNITSKFCPNCGAKKPEEGWTCTCGQTGITSKFCPNCGAKKPEPGWNCTCGQTGILTNFCPNCGAKKPDAGWNCACGQTNIKTKFCPNCGAKKED